MMRHYFMFDPQNGIYMGWGIAQEDPEVPGAYMLPYCATWEMPPICNKNQIVIMRNDLWRLINLTRNNRPVTLRERIALAWNTLFGDEIKV